jgi:protein tyrosine/serine phosphatase
MGIRTILNLRGAAGAAHYLVEEESCRKLGLTLVNCTLHARYAAPREDILAVLRAFRDIEKPFVMHCKSGADRAGFASVLYLHVIEGRPLSEARKMLNVKYLHLKWSKTGILGFIFDTYEKRNAHSPISFEEWVATEYDNEALQAEFDRVKKPWF